MYQYKRFLSEKILKHSPINYQIFTGDIYNSQVRDPYTNKAICHLKGFNGNLSCVDFSPDGTKIALGTAGGGIVLWDLLNRQCLYELNSRIYSFSNVKFSPDGSKIISSTFDNTILIWEVTTGCKLLEISENMHYINDLNYSLDSNYFASASDDCIVRVWDAFSGRCLHRLREHSHFVKRVNFSPDGTRIISWAGPRDSKLRVWDSRSGQCLLKLSEDSLYVESLKYTPDGKWIVLESWYHMVSIWDTKSGHRVRNIQTSKKNLFDISPCSSYLLYGFNKSFTMVNLNTLTDEYSINVNEDIEYLHFSNDSLTCIIHTSHSVYVFDV